MPRMTLSGVSGAGLSAGSFILNIGMFGTTFILKPHRILWGSEGAIVPAQVTVGLFRSTLRGTQTTSLQGQTECFASGFTASNTGTVDTAWTVNPTIGTVPLVRRSFDVLSESEWAFEAPDELDTGGGANGLAAQVLDSAVPAGVSLTWQIFWEE